MTSQAGLANHDDSMAVAEPRRPADRSERDGIDDASGDPADATRQDWIEAENSRPTLPEETADGLDDMDEEVRHQAEDLPDLDGRS